MTTGTHDISTLLATQNMSVAEFGMDKIQTILAAELARHNAIVQGLFGDLATPTTERLEKYGISQAGEMVEVDEYGRAPTQVQRPGDTLGYPLRLFQYAIGWTQKWFDSHTPSDMATAVQAGERAHLRAISGALKKAFMLSSNYTFSDFLVDRVDLPVKRLVNADSANIPEGPNNETFDGATHTHYIGEASLTAAFLKAWIVDLVEHGHGNNVKIAINKADEDAVRALSGFQGYPDPRVVYRATDTPGQTLDITRIDNRAIGIFSGGEVWVKSWMPATYTFIWDAGSDRPLKFRQRTATTLQGLRIAGTISAFPLYAQYMEAEFGVAVGNRTNGVMAYWGNATYADPTITN